MKKHYLILLLITFLAIAVAFFAYIEYSRTKKDLDLLINSEAKNLIESLKYAIDINVRSNEYIQKEIQNSIIAASALADHLNAHKKLENNQLVNFAIEYDIDIVIIIDSENIINSNLPNIKYDDLHTDLIDDVEYMKSEKFEWLELGRVEINSEYYYLIGGLYQDPNSIVICGINDLKLLDLRLSVGIGALLKDFGKNEDIEYIILEDEQGIIAATKNFNDFLNIKPFDSTNIPNYTNSYVIENDTISILEAISFIDTDGSDYFLRIGLSLDKVDTIKQRTLNRTVLLTIGLFLIVAGSAAYAFQRGKHKQLLEEHSKIIEYTGLLLSNINDAVLGINQDNRLILYNKKAEELFGNKKDSLYSEIFPNDEFLLNQSFTSIDSTFYKEIEYSEGDLKYTLAFSNSIVFDKSGSPELSIAIIRDITHIKEAEQVRLRNEKLTATGELAAGVAHEIRNPMNAINVIAQRLEIEFEPNDSKDEYFSLISTVRREIKRIDKIINQFISFSKLTPPFLAKNNLNSVVQKSIYLLASIAERKQISIVSNIPEDIDVLIDNDKFEQVIINLLQNAIDSIDSNGRIQISAESDKNKVLITIADNGKGIDDEIKSKIFDLYFTTKSNGMGLGLGIVNKIILEHNGKITFDSHVDEGTIFKIEIQKA